MKYIRDSQKKFEIKSILLTTLIGNEVYASDSQGSYHIDLPTSFVTLLNRLDAVLQSNAIRDLSYAITPLFIGFTYKVIGLDGIFIVNAGIAILLLVFGLKIFKRFA